MFDCCIWDIKDLKGNKVLVDLEINDEIGIVDNYDLELDLTKMGLTQKDDFAMTLNKDITRFINGYYNENKKIPTSDEIKNKMEVNWNETKMWLAV